MIMNARKAISAVLTGSLALGGLGTFGGCENLPGDEKTQGAVIGGVGGAAAGAAIGGEDHRLAGGLIGGALGAAGGYVIGQQVEKKRDRDHDYDRDYDRTGDYERYDRETADRDRERAIRASEDARARPVSPDAARTARTADVNGDGFVTLDEVVAMRRADLSDSEMIRRLENTGQVFTLGSEQERYLLDNGVSMDVVRAMRSVNRDRGRYDDYDNARRAGDRY